MVSEIVASNALSSLFYGKTKSYITTAAGARCKEEPWTDIKVDVAREFNDIYLALDGAFDMQKVHINGAEAEQHGTISKPPPILQIQIQRVQFDQVQMRSFKSNNHLDLKETIYLDRYMDSLPEQDLHEMRQEKWRLKQELQDLERRQVELAGTVSSHRFHQLMADAKLLAFSLEMRWQPYSAPLVANYGSWVVTRLKMVGLTWMKLRSITRLKAFPG